MSDIQSHLARYQPKDSTSEAEMLELKLQAWRWRGVLVVGPEQLTNAIDQAFVEGLGKRLYGRRRGR